MKIAVCAKNQEENSVLANRFARAEYFTIFDSETKEYQSIKNEAVNAAGGASGQAIRLLDQAGVSVVLCPEVGPKALEALQAFEIKAYDFSMASTVHEAIDFYNTMELPLINSSHKKSYK